MVVPALQAKTKLYCSGAVFEDLHCRGSALHAVRMCQLLVWKKGLFGYTYKL